ncbi:hypothetical protein MW887_009073 [Aspergillus wentii]|nr:hypothetical protein MW887_009073 [Aspergillus wentii]
MGVDTRRPILPAPTESIVDTTTGGSVTGTDLATDVSRRTDKTSYSIPDDGSPVTIPTSRRRHRERERERGDDSKLSHSQHSQTSLLIEYFEGGKGSGSLVSRPSVRVRVTPSTARKLKDQKDHHIQITEGGGQRKPVYSRRISLSSPPSKQRQLAEPSGDDQSISSSNSATDDNNNHHSSRQPPFEIEFVNRGDQSSELSSLSRDTRLIQPTSDISSMPADSMLDAPPSSSGPRRKRSSSLSREPSHHSKDLLKTPTRQRSRSLSHERIAHRVAEKLSNEPRNTSASRRRRAEREMGRSDQDILEQDLKSPRRRFQGHIDDDIMASPESSLLSASAVSSRRRSGDQQSFRSGTSNRSSINNPKLLETVEDAIRRLILPELKELKKDQKVSFNTSKFERELKEAYSPASTPSRDELGRRLSKHASAPDVRKPKVVLNKDSQDEGLVLAGEPAPTPAPAPAPSKKERKSSKGSEISDMGYVKWANRPDLTETDKLRRQRSRGLRDAEKAGIVGTALTAAALQRHESKSSMGETESRRGSESRSRAPSINETELVFQRHNVAPMPLRSAVETELTRDSLLSQRTETATPHQNFRYQDVPRESPLQVTSPTSRTPNRTPLDTRYELGLRHSNMSQHNLSIHSASDRDLREGSRSPMGEAAAGAIAAAAAANLLDAYDDHDDNLSENTKRRTLSPIQSVASDLTEVRAQHSSAPHDKHAYSEGEKELEPRFSISSLSSAPSTNLARSTRAGGISIESQIEILRLQKEVGHELGYEESPRPSRENWAQDSEADDDYGYQHSTAGSNTTLDAKRMNYPEDSEIDYLEKANQGKQVGQGTGVNPQFVHPSTVESAVASLLDPSIVDTKSAQNANRSHHNLPEQLETRSNKSMDYPEPSQSSRQGSPLKQRQDASSPDETSFPKRMGATSPPQSVTQSIEDQFDPANIFPADMRDLESPMPDVDHDLDSESEINTNPSIIQGPAGGVSHDNRDHWGYNSTPPKAGHSPFYDNAAAGDSGGLGMESGEQPGYNQDYYPADPYAPDNYFDHGQMFGTPPGVKDEGYVSAPNPVSPSIGSPRPGSKGLGGMDAGGMGLFDSPGADDSFTPSHQRNLSGYSHGVGSPLYDSATGKGIDRIQSKDIIALMDHLTVRDAQRNARDTEILVSLVRSAAEMRNSFEEMKKFISQQDGMLMESNERQHERTYKALGGPRPQPPSGPRPPRQNSADDADDMRSKRKNVFKRALKGLNLKSGNDLTKIEDMLEQLLEEVEMLRAGQDDMFYRGSGGTRAPSVDTEGYEPEGHAGTSSPDHSGYLSNSSRPAAGNQLRRDSEHRVSTVHEADEEAELDDRDFPGQNMASRENSKARSERGGSAPVSTSPRGPVASGALSSESTPPKTNEKQRKHKSSSSSFFPKISRWSKTTASSMGDNIRNSIQPGRKERASFDVSRSGSDLGQPYKNDYYDPQGDDKIRSTFTLDDQQQQENRPPSPLVPSQMSEAPKYRAHRDSIDMQHPQPRQGPTGRYQSQLETQAQVYQAPPEQWGSNPSLSAVNTNQNRHSGPGRLSPISDAGYSEASSRHTGPPRPPKIRDDGPLIPERPPKVNDDEERSYASRVASRQSSIMKSPRNTPPPRKPTGPRPLNSGSQYSSPGNPKRSRYRGSPDQIDDDID